MDVAQMDDVPSGNDTNGEALFSEEEKEILSLYDQVQTLELEVALTKARVRLAEIHAKDTSRVPPPPSSPEEIQTSRANLLEAMALYNLRNAVTTNVLSANPILKALHRSTTASPPEQDLAPSVCARDAAAAAAARPAASLRDVLDRLSAAEGECLRARRRNRALAAEVFQIAGRDAEAAHRGAAAGGKGPGDQVAALEARLVRRRRLWRVAKGTAAGIVAGSGVDWVGDEELREVVLDPE